MSSEHMPSGVFDPNQHCKYGFEAVAGALMRGRMRMILGHVNDMYHDVSVSFREDKGILSSTFGILVSGPYVRVMEAVNDIQNAMPQARS